MPPREGLFEGLREEDIVSDPKEEVEQLILLGEPLCSAWVPRLSSARSRLNAKDS